MFLFEKTISNPEVLVSNAFAKKLMSANPAKAAVFGGVTSEPNTILSLIVYTHKFNI